MCALPGLAGKPRNSAMSKNIAIVVDGKLGVGRFAVVDVAKAAADAQDIAGQRMLVDGPAGDVDLVDAVVSDFAVAGLQNQCQS